jgi:hypothetical protein
LLSGISPRQQLVLVLGLLLLRLRLPGAVGQGAGRGVTVHDQSDPERVNFTNPRTTPQGQNKYIFKNTTVTPQGKKRY